MKIVGIIPARYASTRYPGKPLALLLGKPLIYWVWGRAKQVKLLNDLIVATDDQRIVRAVERFSGKAMLTSKKCRSGTERCAEAARKISADFIVNIQGDEPLISPLVITQVINASYKEKDVFLTTAVVKIRNKEEYLDENIVKVVFDHNNYALYFSRAPVPYPQGGVIERFSFYKHLGVYVYPKKSLLEFKSLLPTPLEKIENLEPLRILENGYRIRIVLVKKDSYSVETPADLQKVEQILEKHKHFFYIK